MIRLTLCAFLLTLLSASGVRADGWDARWYNPKPAEGDLVLPTACGGAMVFRAVDVPAGAGPLEDRLVTLGQPDTGLGYTEYLRKTFLAAPFPAAGESRRFYMGKYAVTRDQFAALRGVACPTPSAAGRVAQTAISWIEAVDTAARWSSWLLANARDRLPRRENTYGFVRLPTEEEWEYAARGGTAVSEEDFLAPTWPMPEGIEKYAMAGSRLTAGKVQQVGQMLPNPLGLYDMLGNAAQMTIEPFRLNRVGRAHGQAGGVVARGGNYTSPPASLHTAMREEIPPYDPATSEPTKLATLGFRLALSADTVGSLQEAERARADFEKESGTHREAVDDPHRIIALLKEATADDALRQGLDRLNAELAGNERARADEARVALGAQLEAATVLAQNVWSLENTAKLQEQLAQIFPDPAQAQQVRAAAARRRNDQAGSLDGYLRLLRQIATGPAHEEMASGAEVVRQELQSRGQNYLTPFLAVLVRHADAVVQSRPALRDQALRDILAIPAETARPR